MNEIETALEDLDILVEVARQHMGIAQWLGIVPSALIIKESLEKQIEKKPILKDWIWKCSVCGYQPKEIENNYCEKCGNKFDWD